MSTDSLTPRTDDLEYAEQSADCPIEHQLISMTGHARKLEAAYAYKTGRTSGMVASLSAWMFERGFSTEHGDTMESLLHALSRQIDDLRKDSATKEQRC